MNTNFSMAVRYHLISLFALTIVACGGGGSASIDGPGTGTPPPAGPEPIADRATDTSFVSDHFSGSQNCATCHDGLVDASRQDVSIVADWQPSIMAGSSRDPLWRAKVASEIRRNPNLQTEIASTCTRCHMPMAHVEATFATAEVSVLDDGFLHPDNPLFDAAAEGVSCTLCHQIADTAELGTEDGFSGGFEIPYAFGADRLAFGQYADPLTMPMSNQVAFTPAYSPHISASRVCASCHNLSTAVLDADGNVTGEFFPEQAVYTEWEHSDFATSQSCADCHMPLANGDVTLSLRPPNGLAARPDFAIHSFVGANSHMLEIFAANTAELNLAAADFAGAINETRAFLSGAVSVALQDLERVDDELHFTVRLSNHSGHKFPTSFPSRRAWLHVSVTDGMGTVVFESGAVSAAGQIEGLASDGDPATFEPHFETISRGDQVQSYEAIMEDVSGNITYTLLEAATYRKDNRLLPLGLDKAAVPATVRPRGNAFADPDFSGGGDNVRFEIAGLVQGAYTIQVSLNYQVLAYSFLQDLATDSDSPHVALFLDLNDSVAVPHETIATATENIDF